MKKRRKSFSKIPWYQRQYGAVKRHIGSPVGSWTAATRQDPYPGIMTETEYYEHCKKNSEEAQFWRECAQAFGPLRYQMVKRESE